MATKCSKYVRCDGDSALRSTTIDHHERQSMTPTGTELPGLKGSPSVSGWPTHSRLGFPSVSREDTSTPRALSPGWCHAVDVAGSHSDHVTFQTSCLESNLANQVSSISCFACQHLRHCETNFRLDTDRCAIAGFSAPAPSPPPPWKFDHVFVCNLAQRQ